MNVVVYNNRLIGTRGGINERLLNLRTAQVVSLYDFALCQIQTMANELDYTYFRVPTEILIDLYIVLIDVEPAYIQNLSPQLLYQMIKITHKRHEMYQLFQVMSNSVQWYNFLNCAYQTVYNHLIQRNVIVAYETCVRIANFLSECGCYVEAIKYYLLNLNDCAREYLTNRDPVILDWILLCATKLNTAYLEIYDMSGAKETISLIRQYERCIADRNYNRSVIYLQYLKYYLFGKCFSTALYWSRVLLDEINDSLDVKLVIEILRCASTVYGFHGRTTKSNLLILYAEQLAVTYDLSYLLYLGIAIDKVICDVYVPEADSTNDRVYDIYEAFLDETERLFGDNSFKYAQGYHMCINGSSKFLNRETVDPRHVLAVKEFAEHAFRICSSYLPIDNVLVNEMGIVDTLVRLGNFQSTPIWNETELNRIRDLNTRLWVQITVYQQFFGDETVVVPKMLTLMAELFRRMGYLHIAFDLNIESILRLTTIGMYFSQTTHLNLSGLSQIYFALAMYESGLQTMELCVRIHTRMEEVKENPLRSWAAYWAFESTSITMSVKEFKQFLVTFLNASSFFGQV